MNTQAQQRQQCLQSITQELRSTDQPNWQAVRAKFRDIGVVEFFRLVQKAKNGGFASATEATEPAAEPGPVPGSAGKNPPADRKLDLNANRAPTQPIEVIRNIFSSLLDAEQLRDSALGPVGPDGTRPIQDPAIFHRAIEIRQKLFAQALNSWERAFELSHTKRLFDTMSDEIGKISPEAQLAIIRRLKEVSKECPVNPGSI